MKVAATIEIPGELKLVASAVYVEDGLFAVTDGHDGKPMSVYVDRVKIGILVAYPYVDGEQVFDAGKVEPVDFIAHRTTLQLHLDAPLKPLALLSAAEDLLELKDGPRDEGYAAKKPVAWERLRNAIKESRGL